MKKPTDDNLQKPWQVQRLEELEKLRQPVYFDVDDFLEVVEFYIFQGNYKRALEISEYALKVHSQAPSLLLKKAQLLASLNNETLALSLLGDLEMMDPNNSEIFLTRGAIHSQLRNYANAIEEYMMALTTTDEPDFVHLSIALEYQNLGNYKKAIEYLDNALQANPDNVVALYELAYCFDLLSMTEESISYFKKLIDKNPYNQEAWFNLGASYNNSGQYEEAVQAFDYVLAIDETHKNAWFYRGLALGLLENLSESLASFIQSLGDDDDAIKYYHIAECFEKMEEFSQALENYRKATQLDHTLADAWAGLGSCEMEADNPSKAIRNYLRAVELDPTNASYLCLLADAYFTSGKSPQAIATYEKAVAEHPSDPECWIEYIDALWRNDMPLEALECSYRGLEQLPNNHTVLYRNSALLWLQGKENEASFVLEQALSINSGEHYLLLQAYPILANHQRYMQILDRYQSENL